MHPSELNTHLLTLAQQQPEDFLALIGEVAAQVILSRDQRLRLEKIRQMIREDFDEYGNVFKRLA